MTVILVPYHLDEHLPDLQVPLMPGTVLSPELPAGGPWARMAGLYTDVAAAVAAAVRSGERVTVLSGDCTTSLGTVAGLQHAGIEPAIVWFDAHGDLQTPQTTASGYLGGMPLRMLTGTGDPTVPERLALRPVPEERILLVGARDLDPPEVEYLASSAIRRCEVAGVTAETLPAGDLYLHLDFDVVDPGELPGLLFPAPGGPSLADVDRAVTRILATGRVVAYGVGCTWRQHERAPSLPGG